MDGIVRSIIEEGVKVVETAGRNPEKYVKMFKDAGVVVIHKCTSIRHALTAQRVGADMISMDGFDCGGKIPHTSYLICPTSAAGSTEQCTM